MTLKEILDNKKVLVMGVLNCTPDSFSDGGKNYNLADALSSALDIINEGADIIDIGGESTRPGSEEVSVEEEISRVVPIIERIREFDKETLISIDTRKPEVARSALSVGANIVNDVNGFRDPRMIEVAKEFNCPVIVMHMKGDPRTMQINPEYSDVLNEIIEFFESRIKSLSGVSEIIIDPGIGFGKTFENNVEVIKSLKDFEKLNCPIMIGLSRKSFLGKITDSEVNDREEETIAANLISVMNGARIIRVHDVKKNIKAIKVLNELS